MSRTPSKTIAPQNEVTPEQEKNVQQLVVVSNQMTLAESAVLESSEPLKMIGRIEAMQLVRSVAEKSMAEMYLYFKDGKKYKNLPFFDKNKNPRYAADLDEFCLLAFDKSGRRMQELAANYKTLGPELYEQAEKLGLRQRDYNSLKALHSDDRVIIAQAIEEENLDKALELMGLMAERHQRQKEAAAKQLEESAKTLEAKDMLIQKKDEKINDLDQKLNRKLIDDATLMPGQQQLEALQCLAREITAKVAAQLRGHIIQLFNEFDDQPSHIRLAAAQSIGQVITAAYDLAGDMALTLELDPNKAANDPAKQDAEEFLAWQEAEYGIEKD